MPISASQVREELGAYSRTNNKEIRTLALQKSVTAKEMKTITSVKGKFPAFRSITGHVVQAFTSVWSPLGITKFMVNELKNYRQKVNYAFKPDDINASWLSFLYDESKKPADMPISQYIINVELMPKVQADRELLLCTGEYDATKPQEFGKSMDGIATVIKAGLGANAKNPVYQVPIDAITVGNVVDQLDAFELAIPEVLKSLLPKVYLSSSNLDKYRLDYFKKYGVYPSYSPEQGMRTTVGNRQLVGLPGLNGTDVIFTTPPDNFVRTIDLNDEPVITDIQALDYDVKIFMEWWEGANFWTNQLVVAGVVGGTVTGLEPAGANAEYYPGP